MRHGLMSWSRRELPVDVLERRVARLQDAMRGAGLVAVVAHTSFARPAAVHWLTNFTPYWSEALLVVLPQGLPVLLAALTPRVHGWIREVSHLDRVISAPKLGETALKLLHENLPAGGGSVGVVGFDTLPWSVGSPLLSGLGPDRLVDASALFQRVRQPADAAECGLAERARAIATTALAQGPAGARDTSELSAAIESAARHGGAEEVLQRIAPDLRAGGVARRVEGSVPLGECHGVVLSVAYKGVWVRVGHSTARAAVPGEWAAAQAWFDAACARLASAGQRLPEPFGGGAATWTLETCTGADPLSVIAADDQPQFDAAPAGSQAVFSARVRLASCGHWLAAAPLTLEVPRDGRTDAVTATRSASVPTPSTNHTHQTDP